MEVEDMPEVCIACVNTIYQERPAIGYSVWFGDDDPRNVSKKIIKSQKNTKNVGFLMAFRHVLRYYNSLPEEQQPAIVFVKTDATYIDEGWSVWRHAWKIQGWCNKQEKRVKNLALWKSIQSIGDILLKKRIYIKTQHVPGIEIKHARKLANS